ncbi:MAG: prepilin peptidase [Coriobacteriia bacterium]|nr:prepilin peptidase [Coriobacteriia bacterium]
MPSWFFTMSMGLFGLLFGSFANVVIWRVPRGESIAHPGSHCPACGTGIAWYDNIPVLSWLVLRARCRSCGAGIRVRYPVVELASGELFVLAALAYGVGVRAVVAAAVFWLLLVLSVIDLDHLRLPNLLVAMLAVLGLLAALASEYGQLLVGPLTYHTQASGSLTGPLANALTGAVLGAGVSAGTALLYGVVRKRRGLGMGDVKFLGALGLVLGPYVLMSIFLGSVIGMVVGLSGSRGMRLSEKRIPFGPWLAAGAVITALHGPAMWAWYLRLVGLA